MTVHLDAARWKELVRVNAEVNALPYVSDPARYGRPEFWAEIDADGGDCEDFALEKRRRLKALGWPGQALRLAVAHHPATGTDHAVLTVDTDAGTYVLDQRFEMPQPWERLSFEYDWTKRQAANGPFWVEIAD